MLASRNIEADVGRDGDFERAVAVAVETTQESRGARSPIRSTRTSTASLKGVWRAMRAELPELVERGGATVNTASVWGLVVARGSRRTARASTASRSRRRRVPPEAAALRGQRPDRTFFATAKLDGRLDRIQLVPRRANGQPALAAYADEQGEGGFEAYGVIVFAIRGDRIAGITGFARQPSLIPRRPSDQLAVTANPKDDRGRQAFAPPHAPHRLREGDRPVTEWIAGNDLARQSKQCPSHPRIFGASFVSGPWTNLSDSRSSKGGAARDWEVSYGGMRRSSVCRGWT